MSDGLGGTDTIVVNVTISPRNDAPVNTAAPSITGTAHVGQVLTAVNGTWNDNVDLTLGTLTYTYQWQVADDASGTNAADIGAATASTYTLVAADNGKFVSVKVTATDDGEGLPATASTTVTSAFVIVNPDSPVFTSSIMVNPNPAIVGTTIQFIGNASGVLPISYVWDFGDGTSLQGQSVSHQFSPAGIYNVSLIVTNTAGVSVTESLAVVVQPATGGGGAVPPGEIDSDGDGFSDDIEAALGTSKDNATSTPFNGGVAGPTQSLTILKLSTKLNFAKAASDRISLSGTIGIPGGFIADKQQVTVVIGGIIQTFILNAKGRSPRSLSTFALSFKRSKSGVPAQTAKYSVKLTKGDFSTKLNDDGFTGDVDLNKVPRTLPITLLFNAQVFFKVQPQTYSAKTGKSGV